MSTNMTDKQLTTWLFHCMLELRPVTITGKVPTMDDVRAVMMTEFAKAHRERVVPMPKQVCSLKTVQKVTFTAMSLDSLTYIIIIITGLFNLTVLLPRGCLHYLALCRQSHFVSLHHVLDLQKKCNVDIFSRCNKIKSKTQTRQAATLLSMLSIDCFFLYLRILFYMIL